MDKRERITQYEKHYQGDYGFEAVLVHARQRVVVEMLEQFKPRVVVEIGCGSEMLGERAAHAGVDVEQWVIVEPSGDFCRAARELKMGKARVDVIQGFFEDAAEAVRERCVRAPDFVVCSGLLNEIERPAGVLKAARGLLGGAGVLHVNVPNARSLHRRLAKAMGIIQSEAQMTERNRYLAQYHVFDFDALLELVRGAGFEIIDTGGYFIKPFTHAQMQSLGALLSDQMLDGLWRLGRELPDLASEIYVNARAS